MQRPSSLANAVTISALPRRGEKNALSRDRKETAERACGSSLLQSVAECLIGAVHEGLRIVAARRGRLVAAQPIEIIQYAVKLSLDNP
jgi:hypothetical protein